MLGEHQEMSRLASRVREDIAKIRGIVVIPLHLPPRWPDRTRKLVAEHAAIVWDNIRYS